MNTDHDILIEIKNDVKHLVDKVSQHTDDDKTSFQKHNDAISFLQKVVWGGLGAVALLQVILSFK